MAKIKGRLRQIRPRGKTLRFQYNPASIDRSGGVGGWGIRRRPGTDSAIEWEGVPERRLEFTLIFDGFASGRMIDGRPGVIEEECRLLRSMATEREKNKPPPELSFDYGPVGRGRTWVIDDLVEGDEQRNAKLERVYQEFRVRLIEHVAGAVSLTPVGKAKAKKGGGASKKRVYIVKAGDTLSSIAARKLGKASRWREIAKMNNIRDPNRIKIGQRLKLPEA